MLWPTGPLQTYSGLEPVPSYEPSTYQPISRWLSYCAIEALNRCELYLLLPVFTTHLSWCAQPIFITGYSGVGHMIIRKRPSGSLTRIDLRPTASGQDKKRREGVRGDGLHWRVQGSTSCPTGIGSRQRVVWGVMEFGMYNDRNNKIYIFVLWICTKHSKQL